MLFKRAVRKLDFIPRLERKINVISRKDIDAFYTLNFALWELQSYEI
jgi:hypothetical protein